MAKGKGGGGVKVRSGTSGPKGGTGHPSITRNILNAMRRDNRANPTVAQLMARKTARDTVLDRKHDPRVAKLRERYEYEDFVQVQAAELMSRFGEVATWAACVQAVKTDWIATFTNKYGQKMHDLKTAQKANRQAR